MEMNKNAQAIYEMMQKRRSTRRFSNAPLDLDAIKWCILTAGTAPSGANSQPWFFSLVVSPELKNKIRREAENEERSFYQNASEEVLCDLKAFNTNWEKPHLEEASALIVVFAKTFDADGLKKKRCYYPKESAGIATGFLISSLHQLGIATLTHTPQPMNFLNQCLNRPLNEKPFLILAIGQSHHEYRAPEIQKKSFDQICEIL